ncbi:MAG: glycosyltransferase family 2 protein [Planctomycetes bacterium]|nr:glycosyltransferase family 2 protein [Planctomycetota bacterium]
MTGPLLLKIAALIPTYNNARTLGSVVERTLRQIADVLVVDDGSTDDTPAILQSFGGRIRAHRHPRNQGKGCALRSGFEILGEQGFAYAIALDSDGQHFPEDLPRFFEAMAQQPGALILGQRDMIGSGSPGKSRFGLWFSNRALRLLTGVRLADSQTGFRAYPLEEVRRLDLRGRRFDLELEALVRLARRGVPIVSIPIQVSYQPEGGRVSHFRPVRDFLQIGMQMARLALFSWSASRRPLKEPGSPSPPGCKKAAPPEPR